MVQTKKLGKILIEMDLPITALKCCMCGASTYGRQWWYREPGEGICEPCGIKVYEGGDSVRIMAGVYGTHWAPLDMPVAPKLTGNSEEEGE